MSKKTILLISILFTYLFTFTLIPLKLIKSQIQQTTIYVDPPSLTAQINEEIQINISIADAIDVCSWEFKLFYKNNILSGTKIVEGPFLKSGGQTFFWVQNFTDNYNATHGIAWVACTRLWTGPGVNGNGVLATINFKAIGGGTTTLHLTDTILGNSTAHPIPHTTIDGNVEVFGGDIAIINVKTSKTIIGQGYPTNINVTVENQGTTTETFNLTLYANTTAINQTQITLTSGTSTTITLTWNTTTFEKGNYTISAYVWPVPGETDKTDNTYTDGAVYLGIPGDVNGDGWVDVMDLLETAFAYGSYPGHPSYDPNLDIDANEFIDVIDLLIAAMNYGQHDP